MYNKLFAKILDSSIWLEPTPTRIVWITLLAAMDQDGFCAFAAPANLANRALVQPAECLAAIAILEAPDPNSGDPDHEGSRIERVPGGWIVRNAVKYREIVSQTESRRLHRERQKRYREKTVRDASVTPRDVRVTQSEAEAEAEEETRGTHADRGVVRKGQSIESPAEPDPRARVGQNPHHNPENLVNGSEIRRHGTHAWCSWPERDGLCIPHSLHSEFVGKSGKTDADVRAWYLATMTKFKGVPIGEDAFPFWRNEFAGWVGVATSKPATGRKIGATPGSADRLRAHFAAKERA